MLWLRDHEKEVYVSVNKIIIQELPDCQGSFGPTSWNHSNGPCNRKARYELNGKFYCHIHAKQAAFDYLFKKDPQDGK